MYLQLERAANVRREGRAYCIGHLYVDHEYFCDTLEDYDRGLDRRDDVEVIEAQKIAAQTAIPTGQYTVDMETVSPKYLKQRFYRDFCRAAMPRLCHVPCYSGILIHPGNTESDTEGCILVGQNKEVGKVINSRDTWTQLYTHMALAHEKGEEIVINIIRKYEV